MTSDEFAQMTPHERKLVGDLTAALQDWAEHFSNHGSVPEGLVIQTMCGCYRIALDKPSPQFTLHKLEDPPKPR